MPTLEEYSGLPIEARLRRLEQTPGELERDLTGKTDTELFRRPDAHNWAAKEIVCHLRDVEELFQIRFHTVVALDEPRILVLGATANDLVAWRIGGAIGHPLDPGRWAEERQYLRNDTREALGRISTAPDRGVGAPALPLVGGMAARRYSSQPGSPHSGGLGGQARRAR